MPKSSIEYTELAGLSIALSNLNLKDVSNKQVIIDWIKSRIKELEEK